MHLQSTEHPETATPSRDLPDSVPHTRVRCRYDQEAVFFETGVRGQVQQELRAKLLADLEPAFRAQLALRSSHALATLRSTLSDAQRLGLEAFDDAAARGVRDATAAYSAVVDKELRVEGSEWSAGIEEMTGSAQAVVEGVRGAHVDACRAAMVEEVEAAVEGPTWEVLSQLPEELWTQLRQIVKNAISSAVARLDGKLTGYGCARPGRPLCTTCGMLPVACVLPVACMYVDFCVSAVAAWTLTSPGATWEARVATWP